MSAPLAQRPRDARLSQPQPLAVHPGTSLSAAAVCRDPAEADALHGEVVLELDAAPRAEELRGPHL
eukprot:scaffold117990_cov69-Phaeocystis_antarctica.AAC.2